MPRVGDVMQLLSGTLAVPNTTIQSAPYNAQQQDWVLDANNPRPITAGGTGATTAAAARTNLGALGTGDLAAAATKAVPVNTDSVVMIDSEAANAHKRWLVSDMKTAFGPANHNHTQLVNGTGTATLDTAGKLTTSGGLTVTAGGLTVTAGDIAVSGSVRAGGGRFASTTASPFIAASNVPGTMYFRPNGEDSTAFQMSLTAAGNLSVAATVTASTDGFYVGPGGRVYFNASSELQFVNVANPTYSSLWLVWGNNGLFTSGAASKPGGGAWAATSDARIKTVLGDYDNGLDAICALRPVVFNYKGNATRTAPDEEPEAGRYKASSEYAVAVEGREYIGLVAQEAEVPMPETVTTTAGYIDGEAVDDIRSLDQTPIIFALVNSCKELSARNDALEARIAALEATDGE